MSLIILLYLTASQPLSDTFSLSFEYSSRGRSRYAYHWREMRARWRTKWPWGLSKKRLSVLCVKVIVQYSFLAWKRDRTHILPPACVFVYERRMHRMIDWRVYAQRFTPKFSHVHNFHHTVNPIDRDFRTYMISVGTPFHLHRVNFTAASIFTGFTTFFPFRPNWCPWLHFDAARVNEERSSDFDMTRME